jgi:hypothetical protein
MSMMQGIIAREDFNNAVTVFQKNFPRPNGEFYDADKIINAFQLTQSSLRSENLLVANTGLYKFAVLETKPNNAGQLINTEIRLSMQDTFVPTRVRVALGNPSSIADTAWRIYTYPNQDVFGASAIQMRALYNGTITMMVNKYQYSYNWSLQKHWWSGQTQQTGAFGPGSPEDQMDGGESGWYPMQPFLLLGGLENVEIQVGIVVPPTTVLANSRFIMEFEGVIGQNSTPANPALNN